MNDAAKPARNHVRDICTLVAFVLLCEAVGVIGGLATVSSIDSWYAGLQKPAYNPPDWLFAPVWTSLYAIIGVSGWLIWRRRGFAGARASFAIYGLQLLLNLAWTLLFFGLQAVGAALIDIVLLLLAIAVNLGAFWRIDRIAGALLLPYLIWVGFASALNLAIWQLN